MKGKKITSGRLRFCYSGCELLRIFLISMLISAVYILAMIPVVFKENKLLWLFNLLFVYFCQRRWYSEWDHPVIYKFCPNWNQNGV